MFSVCSALWPLSMDSIYPVAIPVYLCSPAVLRPPPVYSLLSVLFTSPQPLPLAITQLPLYSRALVPPSLSPAFIFVHSRFHVDRPVHTHVLHLASDLWGRTGSASHPPPRPTGSSPSSTTNQSSQAAHSTRRALSEGFTSCFLQLFKAVSPKLAEEAKAQRGGVTR